MNDELLTEASAINDAGTVLPNGFDLSTLAGRPTDSQWDEQYKQAQGQSSRTDYYNIFVTSLSKKNGNFSNTEGRGYLHYEGDTETGTSTRKSIRNIIPWAKKKGIQTIQSDKLDVVSDKSNASLFTREDANAFISAIKANGDIGQRRNTFTLERASSPDIGNINPVNMVINAFYTLALKGDGDKLRNCWPALVQICNSRSNSPLVNNPVFKIIKLEETVVPEHTYTTQEVITFYNMFADRVVRPEEVVNADKPSNNKILNSLPYNPNLYRHSAAEIEEIYDDYNELITLPISAFNIFSNRFDSLKDDEKKSLRVQVAKRMLLVMDDMESDLVELALSGQGLSDEQSEEMLKPIGFRAEPGSPAVTKPIRSANDLQAFYSRLSTGQERKETDAEGKKYFFQVIQAKNIQAYEPVSESSEEYGDVITFQNIKLQKDAVVKLVYTTDEKKDMSGLSDILVRSSQQIVLANDEIKKLIKFDSKLGYVVLADGTLSVEMTVDGGRVTDLVPTTSVNPTQQTQTTSQPQQTQQPPQQPAGMNFDRLSNGMSLGQLVANRTAFKDNYPKLNDQEKAIVRAIVNPAFMKLVK